MSVYLRLLLLIFILSLQSDGIQGLDVGSGHVRRNGFRWGGFLVEDHKLLHFLSRAGLHLKQILNGAL